MALDYTKKTKRQTVNIMDVIHVLLGAGIIALAVVIFCNVEKNVRLFPVLFAAAGLLFVIDFVYKIRNLPHGKKPWGSVFLSLFLSFIFFTIAVISWIAVR